MKKIINFVSLYIVSLIRRRRVYFMEVTTDDFKETPYEFFISFYWIEREYSSWHKSIQNRARGKVFEIPKFHNRFLRFIFGKRTYCARYSVGDDIVFWTEATSKKDAMQQVIDNEAEFLDWIIEPIKYDGFVFGGHLNKVHKSYQNFMLNIYANK